MLAQITLPCPPSINSIWRVGRRVGSKKSVMYLSGAYKNWLETIALDVRRLPKITDYPVRVEIKVQAGNDWRKRDIDNLIKPTLDALVKFGCLEGDDTKKITSISIQFEQAQKPKSEIVVALIKVE